MVIDGVVERLYDKSYDAGGAIAEHGKVLDQALSSLVAKNSAGTLSAIFCSVAAVFIGRTLWPQQPH